MSCNLGLICCLTTGMSRLFLASGVLSVAAPRKMLVRLTKDYSIAPH